METSCNCWQRNKTVHFKPLFPCKLSWDFSIKEESSAIIYKWQITFQASDLKENHFLNLLNDNYLPIKLFYMKSGPWLKLIGHSNSLCTRATRAITNHAPIDEYQLRFSTKVFPQREFQSSMQKLSNQI